MNASVDSVRPWHRNVPKSLRKQPKVFLWDWSMVDDVGARNKNLVAAHLLKAVVDADCFASPGPTSVPASTFLSQLV